MRSRMFAVLGLCFLLSLAIVSATPETETWVCGDVHIVENPSLDVVDAAVTVSCVNSEGLIQTETETTTIWSDYCVFFDSVECTYGDSVSVNVTYGPYYGESSGIVNETGYDSQFDVILDYAIVDVPLVPEFGTIVGMITILGAVGIFFVVRRD